MKKASFVIFKSLAHPLSVIFKKSYYSGVIPDEWLVVNITPIV